MRALARARMENQHRAAIFHTARMRAHSRTHARTENRHRVEIFHIDAGCHSWRNRQLDANSYIRDNIYRTWTSIKMMYIGLICICDYVLQGMK